MSLEIGTELAGYRIDGLLGRGGMGFVFSAEHLLLGRKAALKTLLPELADDGTFKERFIEESRLAAGIDHPNIIPIYDAGEANGVAYIAMRYVQGYDLKDMIEREGVLSPQRAIAIVDQAGAALDAAHTRGLVHRDVKPANVLIDESTSRVYLTDFGIAKLARSRGLTKTGFFMGTIDYAAPEQIRGELVGPRADIYALGCLFFECLTGQKPFDRDTDVAVIHAHMLDPPPTVTGLRPELSAALDDVVATALAKAEDERFGSCRELVEAARAALGATGPTPIPAPTVLDGDRGPEGAPDLAPGVSNIPAQATPLVGRDIELQAVSELLRNPEVRMVTLTGPGGTGKTRLSLEIGAILAPEIGHVLFVDLAPIKEADLVASAIAEELGVSETVNVPLLDTLRDRIGEEPLLLVLDNFEQVIEAAAFVAELLGVAPGLEVLATSQAALHIRSEREYPVPPLALPDPGDDLGALAGSAAVSLFVERARAVKPDFALTEENAPSVAEICVRLDGLPLALELAAARIKLLTPQAMLARLETRLDLLTGGAVDLPTRQQALRSTIDWSYDLLDETERATLARLGVFVGGCSLETAEAICGTPYGLTLGEVLDALASLVDKSLLRQGEVADGEPRFSMLETIREYALVRLDERGEIEELRRRHAERFLGLAETAEPELVRAGQATWLERLDEENGNIRAALAWSFEADEMELGLRLAGALVRFWSTRGLMSEGRRWLTEAMARADSVPVPVLAKAYFAAGYSAIGQADYAQAKPYFEESLKLARESDDTRLEAASLHQLAYLVSTQGAYIEESEQRAQALADKSLELAREVGDKLTASGALNVLADRASSRGDDERALDLYEQSLGLRRELGDKRLVANSLLNLGRTELTRGRYAHATRLLEEGLALARELRDTWSVSLALVNLGRVQLYDGTTERALGLFAEALTLAKERGDKRVASECLQGLAVVVGSNGQPERAARLWGAADALLEACGAVPSPTESSIEERFQPPLREALGEEAFERERAAGRRLDPEDAIALGLETGGGRITGTRPSASA